MGLDFSKANAPTITEEPQKEELQIQVMEKYDVVADKEQMRAELVNSEEVDALVSTIDISDSNSIVLFGAEAATEISKASDTVLNSMDMNQMNETSRLLTTLAKVMDKFDIDEIKEEPGLFNKLFGNVKKQLEKLLSKYHTMGEEIDQIYVELKKYEDEIRQSNRILSTMFEANVGYYHDLEKYILAGEQGCNEITAYIEQRKQDMEVTGDSSIQFEIDNLTQCLGLLEARTQDLRIAENVAMQSIPMIKTMEFSNMNLVRKINSAFIITLPVFKQALAQAMLLKRQKLQADSLSALDQKTNELLIKNAKNTVNVSKQTAKMASTSSIKIETLENTWRTIVSGIEDTQRIQEDARKQRLDEQQRLQKIKDEFNEKYHQGAVKK